MIDCTSERMSCASKLRLKVSTAAAAGAGGGVEGFTNMPVPGKILVLSALPGVSAAPAGAAGAVPGGTGASAVCAGAADALSTLSASWPVCAGLTDLPAHPAKATVSRSASICVPLPAARLPVGIALGIFIIGRLSWGNFIWQAKSGYCAGDTFGKRRRRADWALESPACGGEGNAPATGETG